MLPNWIKGSIHRDHVRTIETTCIYIIIITETKTHTYTYTTIHFWGMLLTYCMYVHINRKYNCKIFLCSMAGAVSVACVVGCYRLATAALALARSLFLSSTSYTQRNNNLVLSCTACQSFWEAPPPLHAARHQGPPPLHFYNYDDIIWSGGTNVWCPKYYQDEAAHTVRTGHGQWWTWHGTTACQYISEKG